MAQSSSGIPQSAVIADEALATVGTPAGAPAANGAPTLSPPAATPPQAAGAATGLGGVHYGTLRGDERSFAPELPTTATNLGIPREMQIATATIAPVASVGEARPPHRNLVWATSLQRRATRWRKRRNCVPPGAIPKTRQHGQRQAIQPMLAWRRRPTFKVPQPLAIPTVGPRVAPMLRHRRTAPWHPPIRRRRRHNPTSPRQSQTFNRLRRKLRHRRPLPRKPFPPPRPRFQPKHRSTE